MNQLYRIGLTALALAGIAVGGLRAQENVDDATGGETDFSKVGVGMGNFLNIPVGARAVGMGGGYVALANDNSAMYWNPAGLTGFEGASASYSFAPMFAGITHNFAGVSFPVGDAYKAGISAIAYGTDDIEVTTMFDQDGTGEMYRASDLAIGLSFAGQLTDQFSFGVTARYVNLSIAQLNAAGVSFDAGTLYRPGIWGLSIGFAVANLSGPFRYSGSNLVTSGGLNQTTGNQNPDAETQPLEGSLPLTFRAGLASNIFEGEEDQSLIVATEFSTASDRSEFLSLGAEYTWNNLVSARVGYQLGTEEAYGISGGLGVRYQTGSVLGQLDYAVRPHKTLGLVNQVTASISFE